MSVKMLVFKTDQCLSKLLRHTVGLGKPPLTIIGNGSAQQVAGMGLPKP